MDSKDENISITSSLKKYMGQVIEHVPQSTILTGSLDSIYTRAMESGYSLRDYVQKDPDKALKEAEIALSEWDKILTSIALEGCLTTQDGNVIGVTKDTSKLIQKRVERAQEDLDAVISIVATMAQNGEARKDHLIRVLYKRAVERGDTKALIYMIDRIEGRPGESKVTALDYDNMYNVYLIIHSCFKQQLDVLNSGPGTKLVMCSRRSGKTRFAAALLLIEALSTPRTTCLYIGETMELSEKLVNTAINEIVDEADLKDAKGNRLNWKHFDNGSEIMIRGLSNTKDPDQIRGFKAKVIVIDEFFHLKSELLEYLMREVLEPMQMDFASTYKFVCCGTPASIKGTFGDYAWDNWDVPHFSWNAFDNPFPKGEDKMAYVQRKLKEKGLDESSSYAQREYWGRRVYDEDLLLYPDYHCYDPHIGMPKFHIDRILIGLDYGCSDNDAIIATAWDTEARRGYVFFERKFNRLTIANGTSQLAVLKDEVSACWEMALDFFPDLELKEANKRIFWDTDDNEAKSSQELILNVRCKRNNDIRLQMQNGHKTDKVLMFDKIRDLMRTADLLLPEGSLVEKECMMTVLKRGANGEVYREIDNKVYHPDLLPALRYSLWNVIGNEVAH